MATSSVSSLGLGSNGVLSYDVIDKLKNADESVEIKPIDTKITDTKTKQSDLSILTTYTATLKSAISSLSDEVTYLQRSSSVTGEAASVTASAGTAIQDFSLDVKSIAATDIYQSIAFTAQTSTFASGNDTLALNIDGKDISIDVDATTTIEELRDKINEQANGKITASILNVGGDKPYRLVLKSSDTGSHNAINITSTGSATLDLGFNNYTYTGTAPSGTYSAGANGADTLTFNINGTDYSIAINDGEDINDIQARIESDLGDVLHASVVNGVLSLESLDGAMSVSSLYGSDTVFGLNSMDAPKQTNHLQTAADANFDFNGVSITRDSNNISDLIVGVNITLKDTGKSNVSITQDTSAISDNIDSFISAYNKLINNLNAAIKYDTDSETAGSLQGVSEVVGLKAAINRQLLSVNDKGENLAQYGIALNEAGSLEIKTSEFQEALSSNPQGLENFFKGKTTVNTTTYTGSSIDSGPIDVVSGDFSINGVDIIASLNGTSLENAQALKNAINEANINGVTAYINENNSSVYLKSSSGEDIQIQGDSTKLASLGFSASTVYGSTNATKGFFTDFNDLLQSYIGDNKSILNLLSTSYDNQLDSMAKEKKLTQERIDTKYETMAAKFAAYDKMINKINTNYQSLSMMIDQAAKNK